MANNYVAAAEVITSICSELSYSRSHVAKILRDNARHLKARSIERRWVIHRASISEFRSMVKRLSGRRYKLGETGPNDRRAV